MFYNISFICCFTRRPQMKEEEEKKISLREAAYNNEKEFISFRVSVLYNNTHICK